MSLHFIYLLIFHSIFFYQTDILHFVYNFVYLFIFHIFFYKTHFRLTLFVIFRFYGTNYLYFDNLFIHFNFHQTCDVLFSTHISYILWNRHLTFYLFSYILYFLLKTFFISSIYISYFLSDRHITLCLSFWIGLSNWSSVGVFWDFFLILLYIICSNFIIETCIIQKKMYLI